MLHMRKKVSSMPHSITSFRAVHPVQEYVLVFCNIWHKVFGYCPGRHLALSCTAHQLCREHTITDSIA